MNFFGAFRSGWIGLALVSNAFAASVTNITVEDAAITEKNPGTPQGGATTLEVGTTGATAGFKNSRSLLRFDFSNIPTNAVVTSATLGIKITKAGPGIPPAVTLDLRKVLRQWSESAATWSNCLPAILWSTNGAAAPIDFSTNVTQTISVPIEGSYTYASNSNLVADVQSWVSHSASNYGWIMISEAQGTASTECTFLSREDTSVPPAPPKLIVNFTIPAAAPVLSVLSPLANQFRFQFNAESNRTYAAEYSGSLLQTNWSVLTNLPASATNTTITVSDPLTVSNRFYRVRTP